MIFLLIFVSISASYDSAQDKICVCDCSRCFCLFYSIPGTLLRGTLLRGTLLRGALLRGVLLRGALLRGLLLRGAILRGTLFKRIVIWEDLLLA